MEYRQSKHAALELSKAHNIRLENVKLKTIGRASNRGYETILTLKPTNLHNRLSNGNLVALFCYFIQLDVEVFKMKYNA